jgi:hypothetical protein
MALKPLLAALLVSTCIPASAAVFTFDLWGKGGSGLLGSNENQTNPVLGGGSGGELGDGIWLDSDTNMLNIHVGWGSGNGFTDMTGTVRAGHIHGITVDTPPSAFLQNRPVLIGLDTLSGFNDSATDGGFMGSVMLTDAQETALLEGRLYLNFHTARFPGGEIRGTMVVPAPATLALALAGLALLGGVSRMSGMNGAGRRRAAV